MAIRTRKPKPVVRKKTAPTKIAALTAPERETVILTNDHDSVAVISTHQKAMLTKLRSNPAAKEVEDLSIGSSVGARFEIPSNLVSVRKPAKITKADREAKRARATSNLPSIDGRKPRKSLRSKPSK